MSSAATALRWRLADDDGGQPTLFPLDDVPVNGAYLFRYPTDDDPAILVRLPGDELHAMSQKCTHLSCVVYYESDTKQMICPCHEGVFDVRGKVVKDLLA